MASGIDLIGRAANTGSSMAKGTDKVANNAPGSLEYNAGIINIASAYSAALGIGLEARAIAPPFSYQLFNLTAQASNLAAQSLLLRKALDSGDQGAIVEASIGIVGGIAGVISAIPTPLAPGARALNLSASAALFLWKERGTIEAIWDDVESALQDITQSLETDAVDIALSISRWLGGDSSLDAIRSRMRSASSFPIRRDP
ncbi:MAG: hypothetical protein IPL72_00855 [Sulfuritalea sp.]|nr:hypothetical protein [Sulfuritalea sp.]